MGDVLEYLVDGTSGLAPGGVDGSAIFAGVCSKGEVGKAYLIGKRSDLKAMLGSGPLVDRIRDVLVTGGQEPVLVAVPVAGQSGGYISQPHIIGSSVKAATIGVAQKNADIVAIVTAEGDLGTAALSLSFNGGFTSSSVTSAASLPLGDSGATLLFPAGATLEAGAIFRVTVRTAIGPMERFGLEKSPMITVSGEVLAGAELVVQIVKPGGRNEGTYQLSVDGGDNFLKTRTIPADGAVTLADYGVTVTFPADEYSGGVTYTCRLLPPAPSIVDVMTALESPLALYDVEFVQVVGPTDSVDWSAAQAKTDELWNLHRPTYFKMEARLPHDNEDLNDFAAYLLAEKADFAGRSVQVCAQFGEISDAGGERKIRSWAGLQAGRVMSLPVQRATGRVKDGPVSQGELPEGWEAVQTVIEDAGYLTAKKYAGLKGAYWGDSRTMADDTSDFRYEEVLRVVFKAVRLARIAALKSMYDEAGDPLVPSGKGGLAYLKAQIENALDTMTKAIPREMAAYAVEIPSGQDIVNNGVAVEMTLIGIPIIRQIKLFASYVYAGSSFDPRLA
ncbi:MAG: DUF2586 domain-containing protein [Desulfarculales bacterium]|jgi:hypothetical protein|nr:DUF2586 domain-containing protein [Desulfarculales bacterium]